MCLDCIAQDTVLLGASEYPPYYSERLLNQGFITEIAVAAFEAVDYEVEVQFKPFSRVYEESKFGSLDGLVALWFTKDRAQWFAFSDPLPPNELGFYKLINNTTQFTTYSELGRTKVGIVRSYANPEGFDEANLNTFEVEEDYRLILLLKYRRIDLALMDRRVGAFLIKNKYPELVDQTVFVEPPLQVKYQHIAFSKKKKGYEKRLKDFNRGLNIIKKNGMLDKILKK